MARKYKAMSDEAILAAVDLGISSCNQDKLSEERKKVLDYYDGRLPGLNQKGRSRFVSQDVWDNVEALKSQLLEVFGTGAGIGKFTPQNAEDAIAAEIATLYTDYVVFRQNPGEEAIVDLVHDGLLSRIAFLKVYWDKDIEDVEEKFTDLSSDELVGVISRGLDIDENRLEVDDEDQTFSGIATGEKDRSQVRFEVVPPELMIYPANARNLDCFIGEKAEKTRSDLLKEGYSASLLDKIKEGEDGWALDPEVTTRFKDLSSGVWSDDLQTQTKKVWLHEVYLELDVEGTGKADLWKVIKAGGVILDKEKVNNHPYLCWVPLRFSHRLVGSNYASKLIPTQNAKTAMVRGILDHMMTTNNPRHTVLKGGVPNPDELVDNRFGGFINVNRPDALAPLLQSPLNPFVFQTIQLVDQEAEDTSGVSRLSQGIDKDVISQQNSRGLVQDVAALSMGRQKMIARSFGRFIRELYIRVYELVLENEKKQNVIDLAGKWVEVDPETWIARKDFTLELTLGYGEKERQASSLLQLDQWFTQDPQSPVIYPNDRRYALRAKVLSLKGIPDAQTYLVPPDQQKPIPPDPMAMKQLELQERSVAVQEMANQISLKNVMVDHADKGIKLEIQKQKVDDDTAIKTANVGLKAQEIKLKAGESQQKVASETALTQQKLQAKREEHAMDMQHEQEKHRMEAQHTHVSNAMQLHTDHQMSQHKMSTDRQMSEHKLEMAKKQQAMRPQAAQKPKAKPKSNG